MNKRSPPAWGRAAVARLIVLLAAWVGAGCSHLQLGASMSEVVAALGEPALSWQDPDGREQWAYPKGPYGTETFMAFMGPEGRLERMEKVLNWEHFARIEAGKSDRAFVLRLLGPSAGSETAYFERRDELVWEWRFCDNSGQVYFFGVNFDATTGIVRSTYQRPDLILPGGRPLFCGQWILPVK